MKPSMLSKIASQFSDAASVTKAIDAQKTKRKSQAYVAPRNIGEQRLADIWATLLRVERVGISDDFFQLGGHSLLATQMLARVRQSFGVELPLRSIFESPVLAEFAANVQAVETNQKSDESGSLTLRERPATIPLSFAQQRLWFLDQLEPGNPSYNMAQQFRIRGELNVHALEASVQAVVDRHEALRTTFRMAAAEPEQIIAPTLRTEVEVIDLMWVADERREREADRIAQEEAKRAFDLESGPLLRTALLRLGDDDYVLLLTMHHIIGDRWSMGVLHGDLTAAYSALVRGEQPQWPELPVQYADFTLWQREWLSGERLDEQVAYWKRQLSGAPQLLELPTDRPRPAVETHRGGSIGKLVPKELIERLTRMAESEGATLFMAMLAAFQALLARYSGQEEIVVGSPIANRDRPEIEPLIGFFVNTLALRTDVSGEVTFKQLLARVREMCLEAYAHASVPFERLVEELQPERSLSHNPIFQVMFALQNAPLDFQDLPGVRLDRKPTYTQISLFDMTWYAIEVPDGILVRCEYSTDLFDAATIERMLGHYERLLEAVVEAPERSIAEVELLGGNEREQVLVTFHPKQTELPRNQRLHDFFEAQVVQTPERVALIWGEERWSYAELNSRANQIAHALLQRGVGPEQLVGVYLDRTPLLLAALLGVLKAGGAYVPLDPNYPAARLRAIVEDAQPRCVLTRQALHASWASEGAELVCVDDGAIEEEATSNPGSAVEAQHLGYVLFTSGSTGRPKGVAIEHRSAAAFIAWAKAVFAPEQLAGMLFATSMCFDLSVFEIFAPLAVGGKLILAENALALPTLAARAEVTFLNTVPSAMAELVRMGGVPETVRTVALAGEALAASLVEAIYAKTRAEAVFNLYGPTEDTTYSTFIRVERGARVTIGRPIANTQAYILDARQRPVPIGVAGELYLAGAGLARGYYGKPELTAERFVANPFASAAGARMYRTGDLCRWLANGEIEYLGRIDQQVKLRGFRIELGEIESVLAQHAGVRQSVVMAREDRLVAYVVAAQGTRTEAEELRVHLKRSLPEYMVPSVFVSLEALPLSPNGKIDRKKLPAPNKTESTRQFVAPRTRTEQITAKIWTDVLKLPRVSANDHFFELGGHSLIATQVISRLQQSLHIDVPLRAMFEAPTLCDFAARIEDRQRGAEIPPIVPVPRAGSLPLSFAQQRMWFIDQFQPDHPLYNVPIAIRLTGTLRKVALEAAFNEIVRRHEVMRTVFELDRESPVQVILPKMEIEMPTIDLTRLSTDEQEAEVQRLAIESARRAFNLKTGPMFRASLLHLGPQEHVLLMNFHHVVSDGWSMWLFVGELSDLYAAFAAGKPSPLPPLQVQYADYALWQRTWMQSEVLEQQLSWWKQLLADAPRMLELPTDRLRPAVQSYRGAMKKVVFPASLTERLQNLSGKENATLFMTLFAAFVALLHRYTGQEDIVVGSPIAGRNRAETENLIGFFVNTLAMRTKVDGNPSVRELIRRVRDFAFEAYAHQDLPFEKLVEALLPERDLGRSPIIQVWFALQNVPRTKFEMPELELRQLDLHNGTSKFDVGFFLVEKPDGLHCLAEYSTDLFDETTIERMLGHYRTLLEAMVADPEQCVSQLPLLSDAEQAQLAAWNATEREVPRNRSLQQFVEDQVERTPDAPAVMFEGLTLSYRELNLRANQLAHHLRKSGVGPEVLVGVCAERSLEMVIALLGVMKAGGAYVPIDPDYPSARLQTVLEDTEAPVLLTQAHLLGILPERLMQTICLDRDWQIFADEPTTNPEVITTGKDQAYAIYTSGSTGKPKGVPNVHEGIVNRLLWMQHEYGLGSGDRVMQKTPYSFDVSVWEFFWALMTGACLVVARAEGHKDPNYLIELIQGQQITTMHFVPSMLRVFLETEGIEACTSLKRVICSGEALAYELMERFFERLPGVELHNLYGPTEAAVDVTYYRCERNSGHSTVPIGRPVWNTQIHILDQQGQPVPVGVAGELHIAGVQLARGYLKRPELTLERFVANPFALEVGARMYRTGDLCRWLASGEIEYLGRIDQQVKLRGFRIELGEIESVLAQHAGVRQSVVMAREDQPGDQRLVAYVLPDASYHGAEAQEAGEQVVQWATTFDEAYRRGGDATDATFNIVGWNSSYTGEAIPAEEMRVWVETTSARIRSLEPKRVWEIGCGTGLLLFRIAPHCAHYYGTDVSATALEFLGAQLRRPELSLPQVKVEQRAAHEFAEPGERFDVVVLNSVAQYFPSLDYLLEVIAGAVRSLEPKGAMWLGDIRSLPLLEMFHASVELYRATDETSIAQLRRRVEKALRQESELVISPEFFASLPQRIPQVSHVGLQLKRGRAHNELTRFRYDVVLYVGEAVGKSECEWVSWTKQDLTLARLRELVEERQPEVLGLAKVPNARLEADALALRLLHAEEGPETVGALKQQMASAVAAGVEPEELWQLGEALGYEVEIRVSQPATDGACDVLLRRKGAAYRSVRWPGEAASFRPSEEYANHPLRAKVESQLVPALKRYVSEQLPEYMVPSAFVLLDAMPLSANGKVDRKRLPAPDQSLVLPQGEYVAPRTPAEELVAAIWADVLHVERVGVHDNFFDLGGHSLSATQVVARLRQAMQVDVPVRTLFESPTLEAFSTTVEGLQRKKKRTVVPPMKRVPRDGDLPLSYAQQRLWFLDQFEPNNPLYNVPRTLRFKGDLNVAALELAINGIIDRHQVLRTTYQVKDDQPVQVIREHRPLPVEQIDVTHVPAERRELETRRVLQQMAEQPFQLATGPIVRAHLVRLDDRDHVLLLNMHHIVSDGWSTGVLLRELTELYAAEVEQRPANLPELVIQYADFAAWQRDWLQGDVLEDQLGYWRKALADAPPMLALPLDYSRPAVQSFRGAEHRFLVPANLTAEIRALSRRQSTTVFMTLLAAFKALLFYWTQQTDLVIGTDVANRMTVETESLIGFFVNLLVLRSDLSGDPSFDELLSRVRSTTLGAYAHQDVPFDKLVEELQPERSRSHNPLVQALFVQQNTPKSNANMPGLEWSGFPLDVPSKFDMAVFVSETAEGLSGIWQYNPDLFDASTIVRLASLFQIVLEKASLNPALRLSELAALLAESEAQTRAAEQREFEQSSSSKLKRIKRKAVVSLG